MTRVVRGDGSAFLIDRTEVTNGEYDEFVRSKTPPTDELLCSSPGSLSEACQALLASDAGGAADLPRVCVDWCDAEAYCTWAGKQLCRDTAMTLARLELRDRSDFFAACARDGAAGSAPIYGCGPLCGAADCNGADAKLGHALPVGAKVDCRVGPAACPVTDLSGNVDEWTGGCGQNTPDGDCVVRGGSFDSQARDLACDAKKLIARRTTSTTLGFRCCVDL